MEQIKFTCSKCETPCDIKIYQAVYGVIELTYCDNHIDKAMEKIYNREIELM